MATWGWDDGIQDRTSHKLTDPRVCLLENSRMVRWSLKITELVGVSWDSHGLGIAEYEAKNGVHMGSR